MRNLLLASCLSVLLFNAESLPAAEDPNQVLHLLNRITYGPTPFEQAEVQRIGMSAYIEQQLHPENIPDSQQLQQALAALSTTRESLYELSQQYLPPEENLSPDEKKAARQKAKIVVDEMREAKLLRAIYSQAQLQELMVDFWFNHFNVFVDKGPDRILIGTYERDAIRPHTMGKFRDLLEAVSHHPAMLVYLDNYLNTDPNSMAARGKKNGINENYAREIMELHTMGVNGGYTQADVTTLAHILTGLGLGYGPRKDRAEKFSEVAFDPKRHDFSSKEFLNTPVYGRGEQEIEQALDMIANQPATAHYISYKIAQYFVTDNPPETLVKAMADTFTRTGGDIRSVLSTMLYSKEFWDPKNTNNKFKSPLRYAVSAIRLSGAPVYDMDVLHQHIQQMGEPLYACLTPDGYANVNDIWLNSDALLKRIDFARVTVNGKFLKKDDSRQSSVKPTEVSLPSMISAMGGLLSANTQKTINNAEQPKIKPILLLSSPEFVYY